MGVLELEALARERGLRGYSRMRKAEIIDSFRNYSPQTTRSTGAQPTNSEPSVRFRPGRPRQPELLRKLEDTPQPSVVSLPRPQ